MTDQDELNLSLTPSARSFIARMMRFASGAEAAFRMSVRPGGCSGYSVTFDLAERPQADEVLWQQGDLRLCFDRKSVQILRGAVVDFMEDRSHTGFAVSAPGGSGAACSSSSTLIPVALLAGK
jgi:iron-sulfur cluster assembly accessory protein